MGFHQRHFEFITGETMTNPRNLIKSWEEITSPGDETPTITGTISISRPAG